MFVEILYGFVVVFIEGIDWLGGKWVYEIFCWILGLSWWKSVMLVCLMVVRMVVKSVVFE